MCTAIWHCFSMRNGIEICDKFKLKLNLVSHFFRCFLHRKTNVLFRFMIFVSNRCLTGTYLFLNFDFLRLYYWKRNMQFQCGKNYLTPIIWLKWAIFLFLWVSSIMKNATYRNMNIQFRLFHKMLLILIILSVCTGTYVHIWK